MTTARATLEGWAKSEGVQTHSHPTTDSTNNIAKNLPWGHAEAIVLTDHQTQGRGRGSNTWTDTGDGQQILGSWVFEMHSPPQPIATARVGFALWRAADQTWPEGDWSLKAPNDLLLNGKKVAGLLLEAVSQGNNYRLIVGLGMNLANYPHNVPGAIDVKDAGVPQAMERLQSFAAHWWNELKDALPDVTAPHLSPNICASLCQALNKNPNLKDHYLQVYPDGSLQTPSGKIDWMKL
jgi:BirA family biotin operon repressor/biotin-[acetyl-CoA-carboxylase] ligase